MGKPENRRLNCVRLNRFLFATPWLRPDPIDRLTLEEFVAVGEGTPPGVIARQRSSLFAPTQVPDLIGVKDRKYLDHTGISLQRNIGDLMRYAALDQDADSYSSYGGFVPAIALNGRMPPPSAFERYSDEQLYALAHYLYSLKPPPNPNRIRRDAPGAASRFSSAKAARAATRRRSTRTTCSRRPRVHVPDEHLRNVRHPARVVGTDPELTLHTRRGTGYYKVPSLKGVWYRGPFEHMGRWRRSRTGSTHGRLRDDYVPTGFKGYRVTTRAVKGHEFGLALPPEDKKALLAFLRTL